uniref:HMG box domain-containing protein n=1 Tax=Hemiselmis andersenii TaxID=464988 RepID=A0A7S0TNI6_HEMAN
MPKRPRTSFFHFSCEVREAEREKHPELSFGDLSKLIGKQWAEMDTEQRQLYVDLEAADKARYAQEMLAYNGSTGEVGKKKRKAKKAGAGMRPKASGSDSKTRPGPPATTSSTVTPFFLARYPRIEKVANPPKISVRLLAALTISEFA